PVGPARGSVQPRGGATAREPVARGERRKRAARRADASPRQDRTVILRGELDRRIVRLAIPALGTLAVEPLYVLVDTAIVGHLGTAPLAGSPIAATILLTITSFVMFLEYGVTPDVARALGRGDRRTAGVAASDSLSIAVL